MVLLHHIVAGAALGHRHPRALHVGGALEAAALAAGSTPRMLAVFFGLIPAVLAPAARGRRRAIYHAYFFPSHHEKAKQSLRETGKKEERR